MSLKSKLAIVLGKFSYQILHNGFHRGSSLPGKLAYRLDPKVLQDLSQDYKIILVTGTNGKTLTTALITKILQQNYHYVLTNPTGSNMIQGITSAFLAQSRQQSQAKKIAVLEVDEANVAPICEAMTPSAFVLTNIFRDQMDRYGEIYTTFEKIVAGIKKAPQAKLIINADASIFNSIDLPNPKIYYGFSDDGHKKQDIRAKFNVDGILCPKCQHIMHYHLITYANLGSYFCPNCHYKRPQLDYRVTAVTQSLPNCSTFTIDGNTFSINIGGIYNIYNALAAYATGRTLGVSVTAIHQAFQADEQVFGRQEVISLGDKQLTIILVKNPVGLNQVLATLETDPDSYCLGFILNANYADGIDTSWIWDGDFEDLPFEKINPIITGGERWQDINLRFQIAGVAAKQLQHATDLDHFFRALKQQPQAKIYVLATYTAMLQLRQKLINSGNIQQ